GFATTQVDWVGHSMGGVLPRYHYRQAVRGLTQFPWERWDNFGSGDIHKLVLLNSPQWGSPWAKIIDRALNDTGWGSIALNEMVSRGFPPNGALQDLKEGSFAYAYIGSTPIRTRAITGTGCEVVLGIGTTLLRVVQDIPPYPWNLLLGIGARLSETVD